MAKPRMARSAKIAELNLDPTRILEQPSVTMPGTVGKIIPRRKITNPPSAWLSRSNAYHRWLSGGRYPVPDENVDRPGVVPAIKIVEAEASNSKDQKRPKGEVPPTLPAPARLPARASPS